MGLDVGDRTVGVALSDPLGITAQGLTVLRRKDLDRDVAATLALVQAHGVVRCVAGWPRMMSGAVGIQAEKVLVFVEALRQASPVPVTLWDERLTTRIAQYALRSAGASRERRRALVDQVAAAVILQGFLDAQRGSPAAGTAFGGGLVGASPVDAVGGGQMTRATDGPGPGG